jgi:NAD(P)-dependent dehydrogenase (short-subunit alcohol dehydrogenase family)
MAGRLEGKVVLVTGGSTGIGQATSLVLSREGATVAIADIAVDAAKRTVEIIKKNGGDACFIQADVVRATEVEALVTEIVKAYGRLDCAFNNAGIEGDLASTVDCAEENFDRTIAVNLKGVWLCMREEIRQMVRQGGGGSIVNTASVAGLVGFASAPAYVASKFGVVGLTKTAALEYVEQGIIPVKKNDDALHLAICTIHDIDVLVSWNFEHLANVNKERQVLALNHQKGYFYPLRITTPLEVTGDE